MNSKIISIKSLSIPKKIKREREREMYSPQKVVGMFFETESEIGKEVRKHVLKLIAI